MLSYFDCNVCLGKRGPKHPLEMWKTEDILAEMERCGVSAALCYAGPAKDYSPRYGNEWLYEELKKSPRLYGCYTVCPNQAGDFLDPAEMIADMRAKGMVAARMFPKSHAYIPDEITMGAVYTALAQAGFALFVDNSELSLDEVAPILTAHPNLNLVITGISWSQERKLFALMDKFSRLFVDLSALQTNRMPELMYERYGWGKVIFGSGMPMHSLGAARAFLDYADVFLPALKDFACGNLCNLLKLDRPAPEDPKCDDIAMEAFQGKPISVPVLDSHAHWQPDGQKTGSGWIMPEGDCDAMYQAGKKLGVDGACVAPWLGIWHDTAAGNEAAHTMAQRYPGEVFPYLLIDPNYDEDVAAIARHYHETLRFPGVKMFYNRTHWRYNDPIFDPWWEIANRHGLYALMDYGGYPTFLSDVEELAQKYPNVNFFLDHAGRNFEAAVQYGALAKKYPNVYLQLTYTTVPQGMIEYLCREGLADKTMYGTDAPMRDPRPQLGWVTAANISREDKMKILGGNMQRVLDQVHF